MNKKLKITDYKLIVVSVLTIIILIAGVFSIKYFLDYHVDDVEEDDDYSSEVVYEDEINILEENGKFKKYYISVQDTSFSAEIETLTIDVSDEAVRINEQEVLNNGYPTKFISFYGDKVIIPFIYNDAWYGGLIIYDVSNGEHEIIDRLGDKYIHINNEEFTSSKDGIVIDTTIVDGNMIYIDGEEFDVCNVKKSKKMKVQENVFIKYNEKKNTLDFKKYDTISSMSLESYRTSNDLC